MAKAKGPLQSFSAHGKLGQTLTYRESKGVNIVSRFSQPGQAKSYDPSQAQEDQRAAYKEAINGWHALTEEEQEDYNDRAKPQGLTGFNLYLKENIGVAPPEPAEIPTAETMTAEPVTTTTADLRGVVADDGNATNEARFRYKRVAMPAMVCMTFDDGNETDYTTARSILKNHQVKGTTWVTTGNVGATSFMTWDQIKELIADPMWYCGGHTHTHPRLGDLTESEIQQELQNVNDAFIAEGLDAPEHMAYPYGDYDALAVSVVQNYRQSAMGTIGGTSTVENYVPSDGWFKLKRYALYNESFENQKALVDTAVDSGEAVIFYTHGITDSPGDYDSTAAELTAIVEYIEWYINEGRIMSVTGEELYKICNQTWAETAWEGALSEGDIYSKTVSDLSSKIAYEYQTQTKNEAGESAWADTFTVQTATTEHPEARTLEVADLAGSTVTLRGDLSSLGGESSVDIYFEWGTDSSYGNTGAVFSPTVTGIFTQGITGLTANTIYHYRVVVTDGVSTWYGEDVSFKTLTTYPFTEPDDLTSQKWLDEQHSGYNVAEVESGTDWHLQIQGSQVGLEFDGDNDYVQVPNNSSLDITGAIKISAWVYAYDLSGGFETIITKGKVARGSDVGDYTPYCLRCHSGRPWVELWQDVSIRSYLHGSDELSLNEWHYIEASWDGTTGKDNGKLYVDGELIDISSQIKVSELDVQPYDVVIGYDLERSNPAMAWNGKIAEVKLEAGGSVVSHWKLNSNSGSTAVDSVGTNDGTISGAIWFEEAHYGERVSKPLALDSVKSVGSSSIVWNQSTPTGTSIAIYCAVNEDPSTSPLSEDYQEATNSQAIPGISVGQDLSGKYLWIKQKLATEAISDTPSLESVQVVVSD